MIWAVHCALPQISWLHGNHLVCKRSLIHFSTWPYALAITRYRKSTYAETIILLCCCKWLCGQLQTLPTKGAPVWALACNKLVCAHMWRIREILFDKAPAYTLLVAAFKMFSTRLVTPISKYRDEKVQRFRTNNAFKTQLGRNLRGKNANKTKFRRKPRGKVPLKPSSGKNLGKKCH